MKIMNILRTDSETSKQVNIYAEKQKNILTGTRTGRLRNGYTQRDK